MFETLDIQSQTATMWECCEECTVAMKMTPTVFLGGATQSQRLLTLTCPVISQKRLVMSGRLFSVLWKL